MNVCGAYGNAIRTISGPMGTLYERCRGPFAHYTNAIRTSSMPIRTFRNLFLSKPTKRPQLGPPQTKTTPKSPPAPQNQNDWKCEFLYYGLQFPGPGGGSPGFWGFQGVVQSFTRKMIFFTTDCNFQALEGGPPDSGGFRGLSNPLLEM